MGLAGGRLALACWMFVLGACGPVQWQVRSTSLDEPTFVCIPASVGPEDLRFAEEVSGILLASGYKLLLRPAMVSVQSFDESSSSGVVGGTATSLGSGGGGSAVGFGGTSSEGSAVVQREDVSTIYRRSTASFVVIAYGRRNAGRFLKVLERSTNRVFFARKFTTLKDLVRAFEVRRAQFGMQDVPRKTTKARGQSQHAVRAKTSGKVSVTCIPKTASAKDVRACDRLDGIIAALGVMVVQRPAMDRRQVYGSREGSGGGIGINSAGGLGFVAGQGDSETRSVAQIGDPIELYKKSEADFSFILSRAGGWVQLVARSDGELLFSGTIGRPVLPFVAGLLDATGLRPRRAATSQ